MQVAPHLPRTTSWDFANLTSGEVGKLDFLTAAAGCSTSYLGKMFVEVLNLNYGTLKDVKFRVIWGEKHKLNLVSQN